MLNVFFGDMKDAIYNTSAYFNMIMKIAGLSIHL